MLSMVREQDVVVNGEGGEDGEQQPQSQLEEDLGKISIIDPPTVQTVDHYVRSLTGS